jgi:hypothetical protein
MFLLCSRARPRTTRYSGNDYKQVSGVFRDNSDKFPLAAFAIWNSQLCDATSSVGSLDVWRPPSAVALPQRPYKRLIQ